METGCVSDIPQFLIGHAQNKDTCTGVSVLVAPHGAVCGVDVRGGAPATRETDLLKPENTVDKVNAVVLSGGSAFGLEASCGVMDELAKKEVGFAFGGAYVPIVVGASLFDLSVGKPDYPHKDMGAKACKNAFEKSSNDTGRIGAGCGASVGKYCGMDKGVPAGLGLAVMKEGPLVVGALVALNASGAIFDAQGNVLAAPKDDAGNTILPDAALSHAATSAMQGRAVPSDSAQDSSNEAESICTNTTLGAVFTNATLTKAQATKVSTMTHDAYARAIYPVHTTQDGDTIFTCASCDIDLPLSPLSPTDTIGIMAQAAMQKAIESVFK